MSIEIGDVPNRGFRLAKSSRLPSGSVSHAARHQSRMNRSLCCAPVIPAVRNAYLIVRNQRADQKKPLRRGCKSSFSTSFFTRLRATPGADFSFSL